MPNKELKRHYLPKDLKPTRWMEIKPYTKDLLERPWQNADEYKKWLDDWSELDIVLEEIGARAEIAIEVDTQDEVAQKFYKYWKGRVETRVEIVTDTLNKRLLNSPYNDNIEDEGFPLALKRIKSDVELFREENVPLLAENKKRWPKFSTITGKRSIMLDDKKLKMEEANALLEVPDNRDKREEIYVKIVKRRYKDKDKLDQLYDQLVSVRHNIALNAGEKNYRDYRFKDLGRFDYTPDDCFRFHEAVEKAVVPLAQRSYMRHQQLMGVQTLRPWDIDCDPLGRPAIKAFKDSAELVTKSLIMLDETVPSAAAAIRRMQAKNLLDLDARENKGTNGFNMALAETGASFMFTNQVGTTEDLVVFEHEGGHALHDYMVDDPGYRNYPMETAEVASMSMELFTHDQWHVFMPDEETCKRARYRHLDDIVCFFPHMSKIDLFQQEIYTKPNMTFEERHDVWGKLNTRFDVSPNVDMSGLDPDYERTSWQKQMHLFSDPFYYVEYGIAQLGALQMWRNFKQNKQATVKRYEEMLSLGSKRSIPETFAAGGIKFDFSVNMIEDLMGFVGEEMDKLAPKIIQPV